MPSNIEFARAVDELADTIIGYEIGKSGQNGRCDCIGLIMGAMARLDGKSYPLHSTNYFARYQMQWLRAVDGELTLGGVLYKAREDASELNERYKLGGRYFTGDLLDYFHVGVVTGVAPLEITHCTQGKNANGIVRETALNGWTHAGGVLGVDYGENNHGGEQVLYVAYVTATKGGTVNVRKRPDISADRVAKLQLGTVVDVMEEADGWAKIETPDGDRGYMMVQYIKRIGDDYAADDETALAYEERVLGLLERIVALLEGGAG